MGCAPSAEEAAAASKSRHTLSRRRRGRRNHGDDGFDGIASGSQRTGRSRAKQSGRRHERNPLSGASDGVSQDVGADPPPHTLPPPSTDTPAVPTASTSADLLQSSSLVVKSPPLGPGGSSCAVKSPRAATSHTTLHNDRCGASTSNAPTASSSFTAGSAREAHLHALNDGRHDSGRLHDDGTGMVVDLSTLSVVPSSTNASSQGSAYQPSTSGSLSSAQASSSHGRTRSVGRSRSRVVRALPRWGLDDAIVRSRRDKVLPLVDAAKLVKLRYWIDHGDCGETALGPLLDPEDVDGHRERALRQKEWQVVFGPRLPRPAHGSSRGSSLRRDSSSSARSPRLGDVSDPPRRASLASSQQRAGHRSAADGRRQSLSQLDRSADVPERRDQDDAQAVLLGDALA